MHHMNFEGTMEIILPDLPLAVIKEVAAALHRCDFTALVATCQRTADNAALVASEKGLRLFKLQQLSYVSLPWITSTAFLSKIYSPSLHTIALQAPGVQLREMADWISIHAVSLVALRKIELAVPRLHRRILSDPWIRKLIPGLSMPLPALSHLTLPFANITRKVCALLGSALTNASTLKEIDFYEAQIHVNGWRDFLDSLTPHSKAMTRQSPCLAIMVSHQQLDDAGIQSVFEDENGACKLCPSDLDRRRFEFWHTLPLPCQDEAKRSKEGEKGFDEAFQAAQHLLKNADLSLAEWTSRMISNLHILKSCHPSWTESLVVFKRQIEEAHRKRQEEQVRRRNAECRMSMAGFKHAYVAAKFKGMQLSYGDTEGCLERELVSLGLPAARAKEAAKLAHDGYSISPTINSAWHAFYYESFANLRYFLQCY